MVSNAKKANPSGARLVAILAVVCLAFLATTQSASASPITGEIAFVGLFEATGGPGGPLDLLNATGIDFTIGGVLASTGDFNFLNGVFPLISPVTLNDFTFNPFNGPIDPLWAVGVFQFALETLTSVDQGVNHLALAGTGTVSSSKAGLDATAFAWSFSGDNSGGKLQLFSSTASPTTVAEPSALSTLILLVLGVGAFGVWSRKQALLQ